jgi:hypothetical protein
MVSGAGITTAMEVEDSSDSDSEAGDTRDFSNLGFGDESGMEIDDIPGNYTKNPGTLGVSKNQYLFDLISSAFAETHLHYGSRYVTPIIWNCCKPRS